MTRPWCSAAAAAAVLLTAACGREPAESARARNLLLVVVDTLGAEHLGSYGGAADTPHLDGLAQESLRFERAYSPAPWTQPSVASLFTARLPARHGVRNLADRLPERAVTLAEELAAGGFRTHGVVSHFLIGQEFGFGQGFEGYDASAAGGHETISSELVTDLALSWLRGRGGERFFLFVHYFDPHFQYQHHADFDRTSGYAGALRPGMPIWEVRDVREQLAAEDVEYLIGLYHEEIAHTDRQIGRLLDGLVETGREQDTLVVFTADHGEEFMRHGWIGHTRTLYDELLRVPLLVRLPGGIAPGEVDAPVSLIDVAPTALELLGIEPEGRQAGRSLVPLLDGSATRATRPIYAEVTFDAPFGETERTAAKRAFKSAVVHDGRKLIHDREADSWELYDVVRDPEELRDLWGADPEAEARLQELLLEFERRSGGLPEAGGAGPDEAELQRLRELGYAR